MTNNTSVALLVSFDTLDASDTFPMGWRSVGTDHDEPFTDADRDWFRRPLTGARSENGAL